MKNKKVAYTANPDMNKLMNPKILGFNPTVKEFIEEKNPTVIGLFWAGYWRFFLMIMAVYAIITILGILVGNLIN